MMVIPATMALMRRMVPVGMQMFTARGELKGMDFDKLIARINELSRKNKTVGLTDEETKERDELRQRYLNNFKSNFKQQLDSIKYVEDEEDQNGDQNLKH